VELHFIDEFEHGFGWTPEGDRLQRASHALRTGDSVWLTDVVDGPGLDERVAALGAPAGVLQLLDRHGRDNAAVAERLGVPLHKAPMSDVEGAPFVVRRIVNWRFWREIALWFPTERTLVCADSLGSVGYFRTPDEPFGVHPILRLFPPRRALGDLEPEHILFGHGPGFHGAEAPRRLREALATSRRRLPLTLRSSVRR